MLTPLSYFVVVTGAADCIADALELNQHNGTLGRPGRVGAVPAPEIAWDGCDCGQVAVTIQHGPYPSTRFPTETIDSAQTSGCWTGVTAVRMIASVTRCEYHPASSQSGRPPTMTQQSTALELQLVEGFYAREALLCCLTTLKQNGLIDDWQVGSTDYAINGACGEVSIPFTVQVI